MVKRLLSGLRDYDTLSDLFLKLDELPGDLEALYDHMLGDMSSQNRRQGSKLLQLVLRSSETHGDIPMTVLQLSFAEEEEYSTSKLHELSEISSRELEWRCEATEGRMRSRCCGLIEVQESPNPLKSNNSKPLVGFLHRTVVDFLHSRTVWTYLLSLTAETKFDVNQALLVSTLSEMMVQSRSSRESPTSTHAVYSMLRFLAYEQNLENMTELLKDIYIPALKTTMATVWFQRDLFDSPNTQHEAVTAATDRTSALYSLDPVTSFTLLAATHCPPEPLKVLLEGLNNKAKLRQAAYLLTQFMNETAFPDRTLAAETIMTCAYESPDVLVEQFLPQGFLCDKYWVCHAHTGSFTIPRLALSYAHYLTELSGDDLFNSYSPACFLDLWIAMLEAGVRADLFLLVESRDRFGRRFEYEGTTALEIVQALMSRVWKEIGNAQAPLNRSPHGAQLPATDANLIDAVAAKCCRIDELSVTTCGTASIMLVGPAGDGAADIASVEVDHVPTSGLKRSSDLSESTEANKRPRLGIHDDALGARDSELSPWARHQLHRKVDARIAT